MTRSLILLMIGVFMVPGGVLAPSATPTAVSVAVILAGSCMVVVGATFGFVPITWTEIAVAGLKGRIETRDVEFRDFYRDHRDRLQDFATLMCGNGGEASELVREASANVRLNWTTASAEPLMATLRTLLHRLEQPGIWAVFVSRQSRRPREWRWRRAEEQLDSDRRAMIDALAQLPFPVRAAFLLDAVLGVPVKQIAELLERSEQQIDSDVAAALARLSPLLQHPPGAADAR